MSATPTAMLGSGSVGAVVVTYNRCGMLRDCLRALLAQTRRPDEIIVVDNGSGDGTDRVVPAEFPEVTYARLPENTGATCGIYEGMKRAYEAGHEWILLMDDDALPDHDTLERLLAVGHNEDTYAIVSAVTFTNPDKSTWVFTGWQFDPSEPIMRLVDPRRYEGREYYEVDGGIFAGFLVHRRAVAQVGLLRRDFFIYSDDIEYCLRMRASGGKIIMVPGTHIEDMTPGAAREPAWRQYYARRNTLYTYKMYGHLGIRFYARLFYQLIRNQIRLLGFDEPRLTATKLMWLATFHGLSGRLGRAMVPGEPDAERRCLPIWYDYGPPLPAFLRRARRLRERVSTLVTHAKGK